MTERKYRVGGHVFKVELEDPWNFMEYTPVVQERISRGAAGEISDIMPTRAGDKVPPRTLVQSKKDFPSDRGPHDLDFSQYEPFLCEDDAAGPLFSLSVCGEAPQWAEEIRREGAMEPIMKETAMLPYFYIYNWGGKTVYDFDSMGDGPTSTLCISEDFTHGEFYSVPGRRPAAVVFDISTALMIMYTYSTAALGTLLVHASAVRHEGMANMFLGASGTGKSTHSRLWLGTIPGTDLVNDDNPVLRVTEGDEGKKVMVYGSPWSGKTPCYRNISVPVRAIVRLRQAPENKIERLMGLQAYASIIASSSSIRWNRKIMDGITLTAEAVSMNVPCWSMNCLPAPSAAVVCRRGIEKDER